MKAILEPLKTESLTQVFVTRFEELILSGKLSIGEQLPSERELALQLGVSRPVVHEGLLELAFKGLVTMKPRSGTVVNDYRRSGSLTVLTSLINYGQGEVQPELLDSILDFRMTIETETARLAARNRVGEHLEALRTVLSEETALPHGQTLRLAEADFRFHHQVALATSNLVYPLLLNSFQQLYVNLSSQFFAQEEVVPVVLEFHGDLFKAIESQNETKAVKTMQNLLNHGREIMHTQIDEARRDS